MHILDDTMNLQAVLDTKACLIRLKEMFQEGKGIHRESIIQRNRQYLRQKDFFPERHMKLPIIYT